MECTSIYYQYSTLFFLHAYTWLMSYYEITLIRMLHLFFHKITVFSQNIVGNIIVYDSENLFCNFLQTITILHIFSPSRGNKVKKPNFSFDKARSHFRPNFLKLILVSLHKSFKCYFQGIKNSDIFSRLFSDWMKILDPNPQELQEHH